MLATSSALCRKALTILPWPPVSRGTLSRLGETYVRAKVQRVLSSICTIPL